MGRIRSSIDISEDIRKRVARAVYQVRRKLGITQAEFARRYNVDQATISRWERGDQIPDGHRLSAIASEAGMTVEALVGAPVAQPTDIAPTLDVLGAIGTPVPVTKFGAPAYRIALPAPTDLPADERIAFEVAEAASSAEFSTGSIVVAVPPAHLPRPPAPGDLVVILSLAGGQVTPRLCEYRLDREGRPWLVPVPAEPGQDAAIPAAGQDIFAVCIGTYRPKPIAA
jgi:transcriptional regulator with XRE-family HTH domain